jgi:hypothetical protein
MDGEIALEPYVRAEQTAETNVATPEPPPAVTNGACRG